MEYTESEVQNGKIIPKVNPKPNLSSGENFTKIKKSTVDSLSVYEITEEELKSLEKGSSRSIFLNFAIALLSVAVSLLLFLFSVEFKGRELIYTIVLVAFFVSFIIGILILILWFKAKDDFDITMSSIRFRGDDSQ